MVPQVEIQTIVAMLVIISVLQVIAFSIWKYTRRETNGFAAWLLWSLLSAIGYGMMFLRLITQEFLNTLSIVLTNVFIFASYIVLYWGIAAFFGKRVNRALIGVISTAFAIGTILFVVVTPDPSARAVVLYLSATSMTITCGVYLCRNMTKTISGSSLFLSALLFFQSLFLILRSSVSLFFAPVLDAFAGTPWQVILFLVPFATSYLWAFGILIMENQQALSQNREKTEVFMSIFNTHPDAVMITRRSDEAIVDVNGGFSHMLGLSPEDAIGKKSGMTGIWADMGDWAAIIKTVNERGLCENLEATLVNANGIKIDVLVSCRQFQIRGAGHLLTVMHDITLRKHMEKILKRNEEKYRLLIENSYDIIYTMNLEGIFTFASPVLTRLLGYEVYEVVGRPFSDFAHPDDVPAFKEFLHAIGDSGERKAGIEYRVRHKNGQWYWHMSGLVPFMDADGTLQGYYGISRDIDETKRLLRELERQATTDSLTGVLNRRCFIERAQAEFRRAVRLGHPLSIALVDIDFFKNTNDTWGHSVGDSALIHFSEVLRGDIREIDVLGRFGGDEFVVLLPETAGDVSVEVLERLRKAVERAPLSVGDSLVSLTMSAGVASLAADPEGETLDAMLVRADKALYESKARGRNSVSRV